MLHYSVSISVTMWTIFTLIQAYSFYSEHHCQFLLRISQQTFVSYVSIFPLITEELCKEAVRASNPDFKSPVFLDVWVWFDQI